jgi:hypothetical protein
MDITNGFNSISRSAIETGLCDLPPSLSWLGRSFPSFYADSVPLYYTRNHDIQSILSEVRTMQGHPASGVWFNAGLQCAYTYNSLMSEFPETIMVKYLDDLNVYLYRRK